MRKHVLLILVALPVLAQTSHIDNIKQLTHGGQNAEAYWSPDGKRLIFQSTREKLQCDQEFIMNADGSDQHMVSTGKGRTTCGYFLADNKHIIYASTHEAGDACPAAADRSKGYVWAVYPSLRYLPGHRRRQESEKKLTDTPGYDAEGTSTWKTGKIVYTSLAVRRSGSVDHGSGRHRTRSRSPRAEGYDGGAVFSRDGTSWFGAPIIPPRPRTCNAITMLLAENLTSPMKMELFVSDADGIRTPSRSPISAAPASRRPSRPTARRFCSPPTNTIATAASSSCI